MAHEYKTLFAQYTLGEIKHVDDPLATVLNEHAKEGWEVHQLSQSSGGFGLNVLVVLRRLVN